ncbi:MAG: Cys-tRNA(Pro) deacylase [Marinobacter sp.]|uniref:Cys-tRNA(Pro) deacylase n=1 Tax=Marinobacter sp. TaxID=50741 RepID=UPI00299D4270|nr:Cys-tRNA(Pro) deacylase [Marinobacter sp.]MDX1634168.1 Cys-tRNA(Pro) deacylase [Marinobacter sp.]
MTPGIKVAVSAGIAHQIHQYSHDPKAESYGAEAAEKLGLPPQRVFKTLVLALDTGELVVAVVPVSGMVIFKALAWAAGAKKAAMAEAGAVSRSTGYVLGGVSPLGQKKALRTFIDESAQGFDSIFVSAGRRGLEIELAAADLAALCRGSFAAIAQD